ncbi:hypothetical protein ACHAQA_004884 [Verticillium albo-atrum]
MASPTVRLAQGVYRGKVLNEEPRHAHLPQPIEAFLGVPYARITAGAEGRFRAAQALPAGEGTHDAVEYGAVCPGIASEMDSAEGWAVDEDCLSVNIFRPAGAGEESKGAAGNVPVVVYVHGGAFNMGKGGDRDMASFVAHAEEAVVAVSFNYRVGPLGFLPSGVFEEEGLLNLGLLDQKVLLAWVRDNVGEFGGDRGRVTLMGVSAGAHSIGHHILSSDPSNPLFHQAILESGAATARSVFSPRHPRHETQFAEYLTQLGYPSSLPAQDILSRLRAEPLPRLLEAATNVWIPYAPSVRWPFQPTIDGPGGLIPAAPSSLWADAEAARVPPLVTGFNSHEGASFVPDTLATAADFRSFFATLLPGLTAADLDELEALYPLDDAAYGLHGHRGAHFPRAAAAYAHQAYVAPVLWTAVCAARRGRPVYLYEFAARGPVFGGAGHGEEGALVAREREAAEGFEGLERVAEEMHGTFSRFVALGDPNGESAGGGGDAGAGAGADAGRDGSGGSGLHTRRGVAWPKFMPLFGEAPRDPSAEDAGLTAGELVVFGEGNDERAGGAQPGLVARVRTLAAVEPSNSLHFLPAPSLGLSLSNRILTSLYAQTATMQFTTTLAAALFAAVALASPLDVDGARTSVIEKRCLYKTCTACWAATPPIGSAPGSQGAAAGHAIYCAAICKCK